MKSPLGVFSGKKIVMKENLDAQNPNKINIPLSTLVEGILSRVDEGLAQKIAQSIRAWAQRQGWESIEPIDPEQMFRLEMRDLEAIQAYLPTRSCSYVLLRISGEKESQRESADILVCTQHDDTDEIVELPTKGNNLMRCTGCGRMLFGHQKRYFSRSIYLVDVHVPPYYTRDRFCTEACLKDYVTYLEENADELFPHA
jgi:ferredoxin